MNTGDFCVTEGSLEKGPGDWLSVNVPKMRAYVNRATAPSAEIRFHYIGPTKEESKLGSGQVRTQFGLKLRAQDPCNLVYIMWRIEPESKLVVSVKRNPSEHTSAQCGNRGYTNIKPSKVSPVPRLQAGQSHTLRAEMKDEELRVFVDNKEVWDGNIGSDAARLQGPVGIRGDNAQLEFSYLARRPAGITPTVYGGLQIRRFGLIGNLYFDDTVGAPLFAHFAKGGYPTADTGRFRALNFEFTEDHSGTFSV